MNVSVKDLIVRGRLDIDGVITMGNAEMSGGGADGAGISEPSSTTSITTGGALSVAVAAKIERGNGLGSINVAAGSGTITAPGVVTLAIPAGFGASAAPATPAFFEFTGLDAGAATECEAAVVGDVLSLGLIRLSTSGTTLPNASAGVFAWPEFTLTYRL